MMKISNKDTCHIPIVLAFTPNYAVPAATVLLSILDHAQDNSHFEVICLLSEPLHQDLKLDLEKLDARLHFRYINLQGKLEDIYVDERYTVAASYRLLLPQLLPTHTTVIYLDCDIIVRNDLAQFYKLIDLEGYYFAGVFEATLDFQLDHMHRVSCEPGQYANSGFLIMNLEKLRQDNMVPKFMEASQEQGLEFPDQDVLNRLCKGHILGLPPYYNAIRTFFLPQYKSFFLKYYSESDWRKVQRFGNIHYTGGKPWDGLTVRMPFWWKYYWRLPKSFRVNLSINKKTLLLGNLFKFQIFRYTTEMFLNTMRTIKNIST